MDGTSLPLMTQDQGTVSVQGGDFGHGTQSSR
jgi:hypothetical protein